MINIVYLINHLRNTGPTRVLLDICKYLDRSIYNPIIISLRGEHSSQSIKCEFEALGIEIVEYKYNFWQLEFLPGLVSKRLVKQFSQYDNVIYHAHGYHPNLVLSRMHKPTTVTTLHCISGEDFVMNKGPLLGGYMSIRYRANIQHIAHPIVISQYMKSYYSNVCNHLQAITNGVDFKCNCSQDITKYKEHIGQANEYVVLVNGNLCKRKNQSFIINELKNTTVGFRCIFLGDGPMMLEYKRLVGNDPRFEFKGHVFNVPDYINAADVVISASLSEGMPLAVLETINMGCPILLSNIPPHAEICNNMNNLGVHLFECKDGELATLFERVRLSHEDRKAIAEQAHKTYSAETMSQKYQELYSEIVYRA